VTPQPPALPVRTPARPELDVAQVFIRIQYVNGAVREYTAAEPLQFRFAVAASDAVAGLGPGIEAEDRKEPRLGVFFDGNPDAGGIQVHSEGVAP
jgi:hypothetical protein